jgi:hypothetical protein
MSVPFTLDTASNGRPTVRTFARLRQNGLRTLRARHAIIWQREGLSFTKQPLLLTMQSSPSNKIAHSQGVCSRACADGGYSYEDQERSHCWIKGVGVRVDRASSCIRSHKVRVQSTTATGTESVGHYSAARSRGSRTNSSATVAGIRGTVVPDTCTYFASPTMRTPALLDERRGCATFMCSAREPLRATALRCSPAPSAQTRLTRMGASSVCCGSVPQMRRRAVRPSN